MKAKTNKKESVTIGSRIKGMFVNKRVRLTTRTIYTRLNKGKRTTNKVSIHGVRAAIRNLLAAKQLKVQTVNNKMFTLAKRGK